MTINESDDLCIPFKYENLPGFVSDVGRQDIISGIALLLLSRLKGHRRQPSLFGSPKTRVKFAR